MAVPGPIWFTDSYGDVMRHVVTYTTFDSTSTGRPVLLSSAIFCWHTGCSRTSRTDSFARPGVFVCYRERHECPWIDSK